MDWPQGKRKAQGWGCIGYFLQEGKIQDTGSAEAEVLVQEVRNH